VLECPSDMRGSIHQHNTAREGLAVTHAASFATKVCFTVEVASGLKISLYKTSATLKATPC
jgi:hypothetical protein